MDCVGKMSEWCTVRENGVNSIMLESRIIGGLCRKEE
jgi:hypothetical protein